MLPPQISSFKDKRQQKVGSKSLDHFIDLKKCVSVSTITVSDTVIDKIERVHNSFIRLAFRLPKYVSARLIHEASRFPCQRETHHSRPKPLSQDACKPPC